MFVVGEIKKKDPKGINSFYDDCYCYCHCYCYLF